MGRTSNLVNPVLRKNTDLNPLNYDTEELYPNDMPKLSPADLLENKEYLRDIRNYMDTRFGIGYDSRYSNKDVMDMFLEKQRKFKSGNSLTTLSETAWLGRADAKDREIAAKAYSHFDKLGNLYGDQNTLSDKVQGTWDYAKSAIIDPVNLISFGVGRLASGVGAKTVARVARRKAQAMYDDVLREGGKGARKKAEAAKNNFIKTAMEGASSTAALNSKAKKEVFGAAATDATLSMGIDVAYQNGLIRIGQQENINELQVGLSALGAMMGGGLSLASVTARRRREAKEGIYSGIEENYIAQQQKGLRKAATNLTRDLNKMVAERKPQRVITPMEEKGKLAAKQAADAKAPVTLDENIFFTRFLFGDGDQIKGFVSNLWDAGVRWEGKRFKGDGITNWLTDVIAGSGDIRGFGQVYKSLEKVIGKNGKNLKLNDDTIGLDIPDYNAAMKQWATTNKLDYNTLTDVDKLKFFSNRMMHIASRQGKFFQGLSQAAQKLGGKVDDVTVAAFAKDELTESLTKKALDRTGYVQSTVIRNIVTHPGTTALNLTGWSAYSLAQSATDTIKAVLYAPVEALGMLNSTANAKQKASYSRALVRAQGNKLRNLLNPETTIEEFKSYMSVRPNAGRDLMRYLAGGVEEVTAEDAAQRTKQFIKQFGFDPMESMAGRSAERYTNFFQTLYAVKGQDVVTKSVEFMYNIEKGLAKEFGQTYSQFVNRKDLVKSMNTDQYLKLEAKAVEDTLRSVFSKRFGKGRYNFSEAPVRSLAKAIEEFRTIPVIGLTMPFGQFFNNTVAFMHDFSPLGIGRGIYKLFTDETAEEGLDAMIKGSIGMTAVGAFAHKELKNIEEGLAWYEERETITGGLGTGVVRSRQYDYPYSAFKMAGRMVAHLQRGESIPKELIQTASDTFGLGQVTRQLGAYETGAFKLVEALASGELELSVEQAGKVLGTTASQALSGISRPLDPVNQIVAISRADKYKNMDRRQGNKVFNNSIRYVDNVFNALGLEFAPEKYKALSGQKDRAPIGRIVGFREVPKHSSIEKMFNMVGRPQWRAGFYSKVEGADNRLNEIVFKHLERNADMLLDVKGFAKKPQAQKVELVRRTVALAKQKAREELAASPIYIDRKQELMYKLDKKHKEINLRKAVKHFTNADELEDLDIKQLQLLDAMLEEEKITARKMLG